MKLGEKSHARVSFMPTHSECRTKTGPICWLRTKWGNFLQGDKYPDLGDKIPFDQFLHCIYCAGGDGIKLLAIKIYDLDKDGKISRSELQAAIVSELQDDNPEVELNALLKAADSNANAFMKAVLTKADDSNLNAITKAADTNGDDVLDFEGFKTIFSGNVRE